MATLNRIETVTTSVRPIRKFFILDDHDIPMFRRLIRLTSGEIAGITNLILPYGPELFEENATQLVARHNPDIIVNYSEGETTSIEKHFRSNTFSSPDLDEVRRLASTPIRIWDNLPSISSRALQEKGPEIYSVIADEATEPDMFTSLHFGVISRDFQESVKSSIFRHVNFSNINSEDIARYIHDHDHNLIYLTLGLSMSQGGDWSIYDKNYNPHNFFDRKPTIIIGALSNLRSMLYFWNSRATYPFNETIWIPRELIGTLQFDWHKYTHVVLATPEAAEDPLVKDIIVGKRIIDGTHYHFPGHTDHWISFEHTASAFAANGQIKIDHPSAKLFSRSGRNIDVALDIQGPEEMLSPPSAAVGGLFTSTDTFNPLGFSRVGLKGLALRIRQFVFFRDTPLHETIQLPDDFSVIEALFQEQGFSIQRAKSSATVEQLRKLLGGYSEAKILASEMAISLVHLLAPKRTKRIVREIKEAGVDFGEQVNQSIAQHLATIPTLRQAITLTVTQLEGMLRIKREDKKEFHEILQCLYNKNMLLRGKSPQCFYCKTTLWYTLESLSRPLICYCCDSPITLPVAPNIEADDSYRLNELLTQAVDQGVLAVLLTMRVLWDQRFFGKRLFASIETRAKSSADNLAEIDIVFTLGSDFGLCEVKTEQDFDLDQSDKLIDLAETARANVVIFSTLKEKTSETVVQLKEHLENRKPRLPILILTRDTLISSEVLPLSEFYRAAYLRDEGRSIFVL